MAALGVCVDILLKEELCHFLVDIRSFGRDRDRGVLLTLYSDPDVLRISILPPGITRQGLGGCSKLIRLVSYSHAVDVTLEVSC